MTGPRRATHPAAGLEHIHPLLARQIRRTFGSLEAVPAEAAPLLHVVNLAYQESDEQRDRVQRSLEIMSDELNARNRELASQLSAVRRQARILDNIHDAIFVMDGSGTISTCNDATATLFGRQPADMPGLAVEQAIRTAPADRSLANVCERVCAAGRWAGDLTILRPDGAEAIAATTIVPQADAGAGEEMSFIVVARDVTDRRLMERQLFQSQKLEAIGQLAAGIAHEINTPAQYVADNLRFLDEAFQSLLASAGAAALDEGARDTIEMLNTEVPSAIQQSLDGMARIAEIVKGVKTFGHPGRGEKTLVDLNAEIASTIAVSRNEWKYVSEVTTEFDPDLPRVPCYAGEINHVFLNIIVNAAHAIGELHRADPTHHGRIHISTRTDGAEVEIRISDDGPGIPEAIRSRVFDPFFTTKAVGQGTGQGLAISHRLVEEKHGGRIRFETACPGGTTFIIRLPLETARPDDMLEAA